MSDGPIDDGPSLGEMGRSIIRIESTLTKLADEMRTEMRDLRHRLATEETATRLQSVLNEQLKTDIKDMKPIVSHLSQNAASQDAIDKYRRWLISTIVALGGVGLLNLIINLTQGGMR